MSCRTLVGALVLLVSSPALAQSPDSDGGASDSSQPAIDSVPDAGVDAGGPDLRQPRPALSGLRDGCRMDTDGDGVVDAVGECPPVAPRDGGVAGAGPSWTAGPRWTVDLETVVTRLSSWKIYMGFPSGWETVVASSSLATVRFRATEQLTIAALVPFGVGSCRGTCGDARMDPYGHLGAIALSGVWENRVGRTRVPMGVLVALPTTVGKYIEATLNEWASPSRGFEDDELFSSGFALVPSAAVLHDFGGGEVSASAKVPFRFAVGNHDSVVIDVVGAGQVMVKAVNRPRAVVSGGVRVVGLVSNWRNGESPFYSVALEPRVEARIGRLALRAGFIVPLAFSNWSNNVQRFPETWGVRVGVGYSF